MVIENGEKIHVATRRRFEGDVRRHFAGEVTAVEGANVRVEGFSFVFDPHRDKYVKRPQRRIRILNMADADHVVNILPRDADLEALEYQLDERRLVITDGKTFSLDINEFGATR